MRPASPPLRAPRPVLRRPGGAAALLLAGLAILLALPVEVRAHGALRRASPASGARLAEAPRQLRLTFTEPVELAVARLALSGPAGPVELAPLALHPDSATVLIGAVRGPLVAGAYTVSWQVVGADGHPVRGEYGFTVLPDAVGLAVADTGAAPAGPTPSPGEGHDAGHHPDATFPSGPRFHAGSPLYAAVRWLTFVGLLGVVGAVAFRALVLPLARRRDVALRGWIGAATSRRTAALGLGISALLALAALLRLLAQSYALGGGADGSGAGLLATVLTRTTWGWGWMLQAAGVLLALVGFALARRGGRSGWVAAALGATVLAFSAGLMGHPAATPGRAPLALLADGLHVLGAGGWLGSLLVLLLVGVPVALKAGAGDGRRLVVALVNAFSPTALLFAGLVVATGVLATWLHVGSWTALWASAYGRTLLLKLGVFSVVFATGAYNWLRVRPALGQDAAVTRLRRSAIVELFAGLLVLAVTAVLVATSPPGAEPERDAADESAAGATG